MGFYGPAQPDQRRTQARGHRARRGRERQRRAGHAGEHAGRLGPARDQARPVRRPQPGHPLAAERVAVGRPYRDLEDFATRTRLPAAALEALATAGAFGCFGLSRRAALWAAGAAASLREGQLPGTATGLTAPPLPGMTPAEETLADLWATSTYGTHPVAHLRARARQAPGAHRDLGQDRSRRRPGGRGRAGHAPAAAATARGVVFLSLEDETGMVNVICPAPGVGTAPPDGRGRAPRCSSRAGSSGLATLAGLAGPSTWSPPRCVRSGCLSLALPSPAATSAERRGASDLPRAWLRTLVT